jgi:hypothetical protein
MAQGAGNNRAISTGVIGGPLVLIAVTLGITIANCAIFFSLFIVRRGSGSGAAAAAGNGETKIEERQSGFLGILADVAGGNKMNRGIDPLIDRLCLSCRDTRHETRRREPQGSGARVPSH